MKRDNQHSAGSKMELRKRTSKETSSTRESRTPSVRHHQSVTTNKSFTNVILGMSAITFIFLLFVSLFPYDMCSSINGILDTTLHSFRLDQKIHAVVIDAGSTGSRVLAFTFNKGIFSNRLDLIDELWHEEKPGLSSYQDNPLDAAQSISKLIQKAKEKIPQSSWASTPITLKATAGLRLLPQEKSEAILNQVQQTLTQSGFLPEENLIEIMNPMEEGMYGWFTINFLADKLSGRLDQSFVTLDLGGGSTQITYYPGDFPSGLQGRKNFLHNVTIFKRPHELYSHSYLGLGLMAARMSIFEMNSPKNKKTLESNCVNNAKPLEFKYQGETFQVSKGENPSFENCIKDVNKLVNQKNVHIPSELAQRDIVAFSYFFDHALERNMIAKSTEGVVTVASFLHEAHRTCEPDSNADFQCVDLAFISSLLTKGYGLDLKKELYLYKKINGHETSWALGCAYNIVDSQ